MLILARGIGQRIFIGDNITLTVSDIRCGRVFLGFEAPNDVMIVRDNAKDKRPKIRSPKVPMESNV